MKKWIFFFCFLALPAMGEALQGSFIQKKTLVDMDITITTKGYFEAVSNVGFLWQPTSPSGSGVLLTSTGACQIRETQKIPFPETAAPIVKTLYNLFNAALTADETSLQNAFHVKKNADEWQLTPQDEALKTVIQTLTLKWFDERPSEVVIKEASGDISHIQFQNVTKGGNHALSCER